MDLQFIVDKNTGQVLFATTVVIDLPENQVLVSENLPDNIENPYYDFITKTFYNYAITN